MCDSICINEMRFIKAELLEIEHRTPEHRLWARVFEMGVREALKGTQEDVRWLNNDCRKGVGSVIWLCFEIGFVYLKEVRQMVNDSTKEQKVALLARLR